MVLLAECCNIGRSVREPYMCGNILNGMGGTAEILARGMEPGIDNILVRRVAGLFFKEKTETPYYSSD